MQKKIFEENYYYSLMNECKICNVNFSIFKLLANVAEI